MEIKRGKYILRSEPMCCWIDEEYIGKNGKPVTKNISGYYPDFRMLCECGLPKHLMVTSDANSMKKLLEQVKAIEEKIANMSYKKVCELADGKEEKK